MMLGQAQEDNKSATYPDSIHCGTGTAAIDWEAVIGALSCRRASQPSRRSGC